MCVHREHRTGNCRACHPIVGDGTKYRATVQPDGSVLYRVPPLMPDRWEGDDN